MTGPGKNCAHARRGKCGLIRANVQLLTLLAAVAVPVANPVPITSVLFRETPKTEGVSRQAAAAEGRWNFARPWQERHLRVLLGEEATPADRLLLELGVLRDVDGQRVGGWGSQLRLRLNGTEYLRQAVTAHIIRSSAQGVHEQQAILFTAMLGFLYTDAVLLPLVALAQSSLTTSQHDGPILATGAIDLALELPTFNDEFPRTRDEISVLRERQRRKHDSAGLSQRAYALASPFGRCESPPEVGARRRREAFEDRLAFLGLVDSGIDLPPNRQDLVAALESVPRTKQIFKTMKALPPNSSQWTTQEAAVAARHLCKAAALGDLIAMRRLVSLGVSASVTAPPWADSPLHAAARFGQLAAVEWLLSRGARVQARSVEGWTPLMMAALAASETVPSSPPPPPFIGTPTTLSI